MKQKKEKQSLNGWLSIDKPAGVTSTFVVNSLKRLLNPKKIGHAGTLDPAAEGVLPIALGEATKTIEYIQSDTKTYIFTIKLGETTDTLDREGNITATTDRLPTLHEIESIIPKFTGDITQIPPSYSAIKINGKRAYDLARQGIEFEMKERAVSIYSLKLINSKINKNQYVEEVSFECSCSKGTYIRTLGADIAVAVDSIGYITFLRRTKVGNFTEDTSLKPNNSQSLLLFNEIEVRTHLMPIDVGLDDIPVLHLDAKACSRIRNGVSIEVGSDITGTVRIYNEHRLVAMAKAGNGVLSPLKVFNL